MSLVSIDRTVVGSLILTEFMHEDSRFADITYQFLNPRAPTPLAADPVVEFLPSDTPVDVPDVPVSGMPPSMAAATSNFQFVQDDELEAESERRETEEPADVQVTETATEVTVNGHTLIEDTITVTTMTEVRTLCFYCSWIRLDIMYSFAGSHNNIN